MTDTSEAKASETSIKRVGAQLLAVIRGPKVGLRDVPTACALAAVLLYELGPAQLAPKTADELATLALDFQKEAPIAWAAIARGNAHRVVHALMAHGKKAADPEDYDALVALVRP